MNIVIRADASIQIGSGHVMRCLTLADELRRRGAEVSFICRELPGNLCEFIAAKGYVVQQLPFTAHCCTASDTPYTDWLGVDWWVDAEQTIALLVLGKVDWLIVDHYALDGLGNLKCRHW